MDSWIFIYTLGYNPILFYLLLYSNSASFGLWELFQLAFIPLGHAPIMNPLSTSIFSGTVRCARHILCIFCPSLRISHFSKEPWFVLWENAIQNQDLSTRYNRCYWSVMGFSAP